MNPEPTKPFQGTERFQIVRQLGAGGMGIVYEAIDRERNSRVALKTLQRLDPEQIYLFKQEFRSLANIVHKYLIPLYELIFDGEHWFFTMEQIEHGMEIIPYVRGTYDPVKPPMETGDRSGTSDQETPDHGETVLLDSNANANFRLDDWHEPTEITELHRTMVDFQRSANQSGKVSTTQADLRPESSDPLSDTVKFDPFGQTVLLQNPTSVADIVPCEPDEGVLHKAPPVREERLRKAMLEIVEGVAELHRHGKLHRDLKPGNILIRSDGRVVLLDFGLVTELNHKASPNFDCRNTRSGTQRSAHQTSDDRISGTISYMSPEQASSRNLTPASDWYSVGVILFYILTGRLPFCGSPMQILAAKCARNGPAPSEFCENIPKDLDALCRDLISLNPNERPSVEQIRARLRGSRKSKPADEYETLPQDIPFIGREAEMSVLHAALAKVVKGEPVVVRVQGRSGAGKSALVDRFLDLADTEFQPIILRGRCYEQESVPYKAVDSLVDSLTRYLLRLDPGEVDHFLPAGVSALARIFPVLKRIEGVAKQSDDSGQSSDLRELRDQAFAALKTLLGRLSRESPIIFSIDDLQWGDMDSSALLAYLVQSPDAPRLMLLMSYRSEYLETSNPLRALTNLPQSIYCRNHYQLEVGALLEKDTRDLICRLLGDTSNAFHKQIEWIQSEAGGSVYFIYELVRYLKSGRAPSSSRQIALDEVLWERVSRLLDRPRELLEVISVSGQPVRLRDAREASGHPTLPTQVVLQLRSEHLVRTTGPSLEDDIETFHDRIRESVVSHLPSDRRKHWHLQLALSLEKSGRSEADTLAAHFQQAGLPAKASQYYLEAAKHAVDVLAFDRAETLFQKAAELAESKQVRAGIQEQLIHFYTHLTRFQDAYAVGRESVRAFGVNLPARFNQTLFVADFLKSRWLLRKHSIESLINLPTSVDERHQWAVRLGTTCAKAAYQIGSKLCIAVCTRLVNLCLQHGNTPDCAIAYMAYGAIFRGGVLGHYRDGYEYGQLALRLIDKYQCDRERAEVNFVVGYFGTSWLRPAIEAERIWETAYHAGAKSKDIFHMGYARTATIMSYHMRGLKLDQILEKYDEFVQFLEHARLVELLGCLTSIRQTIRNLRGETASCESFDDLEFDEKSFEIRVKSYGSRHIAHFHFINKMQTLFLWKKFEEALNYATVSESYVKESTGMLHSAEHFFYHALILAAVCADNRQADHKLIKTIQDHHSKLQNWSNLNQNNFLHKQELVAGELAKVTGNPAAALIHYEAAIEAAKNYGYLHVEGMANERAAELHYTQGAVAAADYYLEAARRCYQDWGAIAYAKSLTLGERGMDKTVLL